MFFPFHHSPLLFMVVCLCGGMGPGLYRHHSNSSRSQHHALHANICTSDLFVPTAVRVTLAQRGLDVEKTRWISKALQGNQFLQKLNLSWNLFGDEGAKWIGEALKVNQCLRHLIASGNDIGDEGTKWIGEALQVNRCLQKLELDCNGIGDQGAQWIGEALQVNRCLQQLNLDGNNISNAGARWISEALKVNQCLQQLDLSWSSIGDSGAKWIGEALQVNQCLQQLDLRVNNIGDEGAKHIIRGAQSNLGLLNIVCNFDLSAFEEDLTPFERTLSNMAALLAHWRQERRRCQQTLLLGTEPPTVLDKEVHASPLWQSLARDELYDAQVWHEIFEWAGWCRIRVRGRQLLFSPDVEWCDAV